MRFYVLPYKMGSKSATSLASHFGVKKIYPDRNFKPQNNDIILNWGCHHAQVLNTDKNIKVLNNPKDLYKASNKVSALKILKEKEVPCVEFALNIDDAKGMIKDGHIVYCRTLTRAKEGKGIVLASKEDELVQANLYTKYFKNKYEYRVHVFNGKVIDIIQKRKMSKEKLQELGINEDEINGRIKNYKKGWVFTRKDMYLPEGIKELAIKTIDALGLDFGGVDIGYNKYYNQMKVFEVNTAIGMDAGSTTHMRYSAAISDMLGMRFSKDDYCNKYNCEIENNLLNE